MRQVFLMMVVLAGLVGCQSEPPPTPPAPPIVAAPPTATASLPVAPSIALPLTEARPPTRLAIPVINFGAAVTPMAWQVTEVAGERRAVWQVPLESAGWHINSAGAGGAGNVILSGHHRLGAAVFAPLARGQVQVGQQIVLTDDQGQSFAYTVTTISDPVLVLGASPTDLAQADHYLTSSPEAQLTLVTGWPDFSDTHQIFIVAHFAGALSTK